MKIIRKTNELEQILVLIKDKGQSIGSVLTMGNLHDGHLSLIKEAQLNNDFVVTSQDSLFIISMAAFFPAVPIIPPHG